MTINVEGAVQGMVFKDISQGDFFAPYPSSLYLKIEKIIDKKGDTLNAIDMEGGHLAFFTDNTDVYPIDSVINARYRYYDYEIEN